MAEHSVGGRQYLFNGNHIHYLGVWLHVTWSLMKTTASLVKPRRNLSHTVVRQGILLEQIIRKFPSSASLSTDCLFDGARGFLLLLSRFKYTQLT